MTRRSAGRIVLGAIGGAAVLAGVFVVIIGGYLSMGLHGGDSLRTEAARIEVPGCSTVIMEIADIRVEVGELERIEPLEKRARPLLSIRPIGTSDEPWLIGSADQRSVEQKLLGARYCLVEASDGAWSSTSVVPQDGSPDPQFSGIFGLWATAPSGGSVAMPLPKPGVSVVVSGASESSLSALEVAGELEISGAGDIGVITLIGGVVTTSLGALLLVISILGLRTKGRHEISTPPGPQS